MGNFSWMLGGCLKVIERAFEDVLDGDIKGCLKKMSNRFLARCLKEYEWCLGNVSGMFVGCVGGCSIMCEV